MYLVFWAIRIDACQRSWVHLFQMIFTISKFLVAYPFPGQSVSTLNVRISVTDKVYLKWEGVISLSKFCFVASNYVHDDTW